MYLKDIIKKSSNIKETFPLVEGFHILQENNQTEHIQFSKLILDNYNLRYAKFFTLRPHDIFILGRYWDLFTDRFYKDSDDFQNTLLYDIYKPIIVKTLKDYEYVCSVEINPTSTSGMNFIHFHFVLFASNKVLKEVVKSLKQAFSMSNKFIYQTCFNKVVNVPDPSLKIKSYKPDEKHFALLYYMGFDKRSICKQLQLKESYLISLYSICRSPKSFTLLNQAYKLFPYKDKKNIKKK